MKTKTLMTFTLCLIGVYMAVQQGLAADASIEGVIKKLSATPIDRGVLSEILLLPESPEVTAALKNAFDREQKTLQKQYIAGTLVQLGERDSRFYDYLAGKAEDAMANSGPTWFAYDSEGKAVRGQYSLEYRAWCSLSGVELAEGVARQVRTLDDIQILAGTRDPRANDVLVRALQSQNGYVVAAAAEGLALRRLNSAIPAIVAAAQRLPSASVWAIAEELALYGTPEADREMVRLIKDPATVIRYKKSAAFQRQHYDRVDRARLGLSAPGNPAKAAEK